MRTGKVSLPLCSLAASIHSGLGPSSVVNNTFTRVEPGFRHPLRRLGFSPMARLKIDDSHLNNSGRADNDFTDFS